MAGSDTKPKNIHKLISFLKNKNELARNILWNNKELSKQELEEHYMAIKNLNQSKIRNGYLCSTCDSFLLLIAHLLEINIVHKYIKTVLTYIHKDKKKRTLYFQSDKGHFWFSKSIN